MKKLLAGMVAFGLLLAGCGSDSGGQNPPVTPPTPPVEIKKIDGQEFGVLQGTLEVGDNTISGTGDLIFRAPLTRVDNNYALRFTLAENGTLTLVPNSAAGLAGLVSITFSRTAKNKLGLALNYNGKTDVLQNDMPDPDLLTADGEIFVEVDVHEHGHVIFWINGQEEEFAFSSGKLGTFWGLKLNNAKVTSAKVLQPKEVHGN